LLRLAADLFLSGLFKGEWDPDKHPRAGEAPNPGWFAPAPKEEASPRRFGWPSRRVGQAIREFAKDAAKKAAIGAAVTMSDGAVFLVELLSNLSPSELNAGEQRITDQLYANFDPPKTLEELQVQPTENILGYDQHHIVEQNPANVEKRELENSEGKCSMTPVIWSGSRD
jgi:hypothetical protein